MTPVVQQIPTRMIRQKQYIIAHKRNRSVLAILHLSGNLGRFFLLTLLFCGIFLSTYPILQIKNVNVSFYTNFILTQSFFATVDHHHPCVPSMIQVPAVLYTRKHPVLHQRPVRLHKRQQDSTKVPSEMIRSSANNEHVIWLF